MSDDQRPIGVFDSGIGGLSVLKHLVRLMPTERFVYLGDTARVPYGNKSTETVQTYSKQCAAFLLQHNVKMIVVACNTASALALDVLRRDVSVPVVGVIEPAAAEAARATTSCMIGVIGTRATIFSNSYARAIELSAPEKHIVVHSQPCPLFVPLVEEGWLDSPATRLIAEEYLRPLVANRIDTLVLGCTHYPLLKPMLTSMLPNVHLIDCGECAAKVAAEMNGPVDDGPITTTPNIYFYLTDNTPSFPVLARQFLGISVNEPVRVSVDHLILPHIEHEEL
ncbi:glutamate racemase [soil metagenome]